MGIFLLTLMRPDTAGVHRRASMVIVELSPTASVTVTERGGARNAATAGMGVMSAAHAASTTATERSVVSAAVTRCGSAAGVPAGGRRATSGAALWEQMQDKTRISQDLGSPAARKEQSALVLCAYTKSMLARGASGSLPAKNDCVDTFSTSDWSVGSGCLTLGEPKLATARLGRGGPSSVNRSAPYRGCLRRRCLSGVRLFELPAHRV